MSSFPTGSVIISWALGLAALLTSMSPPAQAEVELTRQAEAALAQGRTDEGLRLLEQAVAGLAASVGEDDPATLAAMVRLAAARNEQGRFSEALPLYDKVLTVRLAQLGERDPETLAAMSGVAVTLGVLGRHGERLALVERVFRLRTETLGERHADTLSAMNDLSAQYSQFGRIDESLAMDERLLQLSTEAQGERHPQTLRAMNSLAATYVRLERHVEALALIEKVVTLRTEVLGERHPQTLNSMSTLALSYGNLGRMAECLAMNQKVLRLRIEVHGEQHPSTWISMANLAMVESELGRFDDALARIDQVVRLRARALGERHPDTLRGISFQAQVYLQANRPADAAALAARYVAGAEQQRSQPGLSAENRQSLFQAYANNYRLFGIASGRVGETARAFQLAELSKARTLLESMSAQLARRSGILPAAELEELDAIDARIGVLSQSIAQRREVEARQLLEAQRNELTRRWESLQARLKERWPKYAQLSDVRLLEVPDLAGLVPQDAVAVSYLVGPIELGAFVVEPSGRTRYIGLGSSKNLADAVDLWRREIGRDRRRPLVPAEEGFRAWRQPDSSYRLLPLETAAPDGAVQITELAEVGRHLGQRLLEPLAEALHGKARWIVSPDGPLAQLPFEALPFGGEAGPAVASAEIHYTQSLSVYALSRQLQASYRDLQGRRELFAMGNPHYEDRRTQEANRAAAVEGTRQIKRVGLRSTSLRDVSQLRDLDSLWPDLPGTEAEVRAVVKLFPGSADAYLGEQATEQQLQALNARGALKNYRYLLLSAHGYLAPEQPALSSIVLGLQQRTPEADGYVTAAEWPGYDLKSELAVLSACDSGVGKVVSGEGVMGLPFAMFVAGNVNTILSLWPVDDRATAEFVTRLFERLQAGRSATQALAETKREFRQHRRWSHPAYWAPFVLVGAG